jgi:hypothetical protein
MVGKRVMVYKKLPLSVPALHTGMERWCKQKCSATLKCRGEVKVF